MFSMSIVLKGPTTRYSKVADEHVVVECAMGAPRDPPIPVCLRKTLPMPMPVGFIQPLLNLIHFPTLDVIDEPMRSLRQLLLDERRGSQPRQILPDRLLEAGHAQSVPVLMR